jgi:hypothetical protein
MSVPGQMSKSFPVCPIIVGRLCIGIGFLAGLMALFPRAASAQGPDAHGSGTPFPPQRMDATEAPYCSDLKRVVVLAMSGERFASIAGTPRTGNFADTTLSLPGWTGCALYGPSTYTCDSPAVGTADAAERVQAILLREIKACLGEGWDEAADRASARYVVLRSALRPVSITLSTDETDARTHVVHLIVFARRN